MPIARNPRIKPLKELALAVGAKITVEYTADPRQAEYVLSDKDGEPVVREYDIYDMLDSIRAYYGGHPNYAEARVQFNYMTGEDE
jgi:hypothetical protein